MTVNMDKTPALSPVRPGGEPGGGFSSPQLLVSGLMILAGIGFGAAVIRARVLPRWTGATLIADMLVMATTVSLPAAAQAASAGVRDLAFAAMGAVLLPRARRRYRIGRRS
jgi:hypothetical protein